MPYEYVYMALLMICPPMWFYIVDPMVKSLHDAQKGIKNLDSWNETMPLTEEDKIRRRAGNIYFTLVTVVAVGLIFVV